MKKKILTIALIVIGAIALLALSLPSILTAMGLHPHYDRVAYDLSGKKALVITTSHDTLGETGNKTGVFGSEMNIPYYEFLDAGMQVDIASIEGGKIPFEPLSLRYPLASEADRRYLNDADAKRKTENSLKIDDVDFLDYDIIFMAGGWGASYDLGQSEVLGEKITEANAAGILLGSVCHGALGFIKAKEVDGKPLVEGKKMTAVTDKQIEEFGITHTPMHPETELRKLNADFESNTAFRDMFATTLVVDGNIVTGQNQNSSGPTAQMLLRLLDRKQ